MKAAFFLELAVNPDGDQFDQLALRLAQKIETKFDPKALRLEFIDFVNAKLKDFLARELTSHCGLRARVDNWGEFIVDSGLVRLGALPQPISEGAGQRLILRMPKLSGFPGWDRAALALMGKERLFERRWTALAKNILRQDARLRDEHQWPKPPGLAALQERQGIIEAAKPAPSQPKQWRL